MSEVLVPIATTTVGSLLTWWLTRSAYRQQREHSAENEVERRKYARDVFLARDVPELLKTLQTSIDFVSRLSQSTPDDRAVVGYSHTWLEQHAAIKRSLDPAVATHPVHNVLEEILAKWKRYVEEYDGVLAVDWDDPVLKTFPMLIDKDPQAISRTLVLAGQVSEALQAASRRAATARSVVRDLPE